MATYYVSSSGGTGNGLTTGTAWSLAHALDTATSGLASDDIVYVMADGTYSIGAETDLAPLARLTWIGVNSSGVLDGTRPVFQASVALTNMLISGSDSGIFLLLDFDGNDNADICFRGGGGNYGLWASCIFRNGLTRGFETSNGLDANRLAYCLARDNAGRGFSLLQSDTAYACVARDNVGNSFAGLGGTTMLAKCVATNATSFTNYTFSTCIDCISDGAAASGFLECFAINCLSSDATQSGFAQGTRALFCAAGSGAKANGSNLGSSTAIPALVDAGATLYRDAASTPPDYRIPTDSALAGAGIYVAQSLLGTAQTRSSIGIGDDEPETGGGGSSLVFSPSPIQIGH